MLILGIDTSSKFLSIALSNKRNILQVESYLLEKRHSGLLVPKIKNLLEKNAVSIRDVDVFVVGLGPGSFTGMRIGVSTVKGFSLATGKPGVGIPSIDAVALNVEEKSKPVVPIIDAKRGNVYCAIYRNAGGNLVRKSRYTLLNIDRLTERVKGSTVFVGDGVALYREKISELNKKAVFLEEDSWYPRADNLIRLFLRNPRRYKKSGSERLKPIYLYPRDCQVRK